MEARPPRARSSDRPLGVQARVRLSLAALVLVAAAVLGAQWHIASSFDHTAPATHPKMNGAQSTVSPGSLAISIVHPNKIMAAFTPKRSHSTRS